MVSVPFTLCGLPPLPAPRDLCIRTGVPPSSLYLHSPLSTGYLGAIRSHHLSAQGLLWLSILPVVKAKIMPTVGRTLCDCHVPTDSALLPSLQCVRARPSSAAPAKRGVLPGVLPGLGLDALSGMLLAGQPQDLSPLPGSPPPDVPMPTVSPSTPKLALPGTVMFSPFFPPSV